MRKVSSNQHIGLLTSVLLSIGAWSSAYFNNSDIFAWATLLAVAYVIWLICSTWSNKPFKSVAGHGFLLGAGIVATARLILYLATKYVFDVWTLEQEMLYDATNGLLEIFRMLINGSVAQSLSVVLLGGLIGLIAATCTRILGIRTDKPSYDIEFLSNSILLVSSLLLIVLMISVSIDNSSSTKTRVGAFLDQNTTVNQLNLEQPERGEFDLSNISFEELERLNAELDTDSLIANNYDLEAALSAKIENKEPLKIDTSKPSNSSVGLPLPYDQYKVERGDTYACIAEEIYGNYKLWPEITALNTGEGYQEKTLHVGNILELPDLPVSEIITNICG